MSGSLISDTSAASRIEASIRRRLGEETHLGTDQLGQVTADGELADVLLRGKDRRRARFEVFEKGLKTIGTFTEAMLFTTFTTATSGDAKLGLYDDLLCFIEETLVAERGHATLVVDGRMDGGDHLRSAHRALRIKRRRILEDPTMRSSAESQLLQMADCCAYSAFQSVQNKTGLDEKFRRAYETKLSRLIVRPFETDNGRCIRGHDYIGDVGDCPSDRVHP